MIISLMLALWRHSFEWQTLQVLKAGCFGGGDEILFGAGGCCIFFFSAKSNCPNCVSDVTLAHTCCPATDMVMNSITVRTIWGAECVVLCQAAEK